MERSLDRCLNCRNKIEELKTDNELLSKIYSLDKRAYCILIKSYIEIKNYEQLGREYGVTRERIRQILVRAFRKMGLGNDFSMWDIVKGVLNENVDKLPFITKKEIYVLDEEKINNVSNYYQTMKDYGAENLILHDDINSLNMSVRATNLLKNYGIFTIRQLLDKSEEELEEIKNFGRKCINEIKDALLIQGLNLKSQ